MGSTNCRHSKPLPSNSALHTVYRNGTYWEGDIQGDFWVHPTQTTKNQVVDLESTGPKSENLGIYSSELKKKQKQTNTLFSTSDL